MKIEKLFRSSIAGCSPTTNLAEAGALLWKHDCGILRGMISISDFILAAGNKKGRNGDLDYEVVMLTLKAVSSRPEEAREKLAAKERERVGR